MPETPVNFGGALLLVLFLLLRVVVVGLLVRLPVGGIVAGVLCLDIARRLRLLVPLLLETLLPNQVEQFRLRHAV